MSGNLIIVSAPSGAGKTTILTKVMAQVDQLAFSVSHTTRTPRKTEREGRDYFFVDLSRFEQMIREGAFLEWAKVHGNYYGTALAPLSRLLDGGYDIILDIDVQGAEIIREAKRLPAIHVFVAPPDLVELEKRLRGRNTETEATIVTRLQNAREEMRQCGVYDYLIVNDSIQQAATMLKAIIYAERARGRRAIDGSPLVMRVGP